MASEKWYILKHDVYKNLFGREWENRPDMLANLEQLEEIPQDDDMLSVADEMNNLIIETAQV